MSHARAGDPYDRLLADIDNLCPACGSHTRAVTVIKGLLDVRICDRCCDRAWFLDGEPVTAEVAERYAALHDDALRTDLRLIAPPDTA